MAILKSGLGSVPDSSEGGGSKVLTLKALVLWVRSVKEVIASREKERVHAQRMRGGPSREVNRISRQARAFFEEIEWKTDLASLYLSRG